MQFVPLNKLFVARFFGVRSQGNHSSLILEEGSAALSIQFWPSPDSHPSRTHTHTHAPTARCAKEGGANLILGWGILLQTHIVLYLSNILGSPLPPVLRPGGRPTFSPVLQIHPVWEGRQKAPALFCRAIWRFWLGDFQIYVSTSARYSTCQWRNH